MFIFESDFLFEFENIFQLKLEIKIEFNFEFKFHSNKKYENRIRQHLTSTSHLKCSLSHTLRWSATFNLFIKRRAASQFKLSVSFSSYNDKATHRHIDCQIYRLCHVKLVQSPGIFIKCPYISCLAPLILISSLLRRCIQPGCSGLRLPSVQLMY